MHFRTHDPVEDKPQSDLSKGVQSEIRQALHQWRGHLHEGSELAEPVDPACDHVCGDPAAPVAVVEYGCYGSASGSDEDRALRGALRGWLDEGRISLTLRHFPVVDSFPDAWGAAQAVEAADCQGHFWEMHEALTKALAPPNSEKVDGPRILAIAQQLELDGDQLQGDMETVSTAKRIFRDFDSGLRSGVNGTPTFYVQGIRQDIDEPGELHAKLESALAGDLAALWPPVHKRVDRTVEIARLWHDGLARGDVSASAQFWADDIDWQGWNDELPGGGTATGRDAVEQLHRRSRPAAPGFRILAHDYIRHGNRVLVVGEARSDAPDGRFHVPYVQIWEMEAGQVKCVHTLTDTLVIARALGGPAIASKAPERAHSEPHSPRATSSRSISSK